MLDFHQKRRLRALANAPATQVGLGVVLLYISWQALERYVVASDMVDRRVAAEAQVAELELRRARLAEQVDYLSDERGIEAAMRRQFDIALPGEEVVVILEPEPPAAPPATTSDPAGGWWPW